jgi:FkbM family methyltransferase
VITSGRLVRVWRRPELAVFSVAFHTHLAPPTDITLLVKTPFGYRTVIDVAHILKAKSGSPRGELLKTYFRLRSKEATSEVSRHRMRMRRERIGDAVVHFFDYTSLLIMFMEVFIEQSYSFESLHPNPIIIDAGANIGIATLFFKTRYPTARVLAIEPEPASFAALRKNVHVNQLTDVTVENVALARERGAVEFHHRPGSIVSSVFVGRGPKEHTSVVAAMPLSAYIDDRIDFLKLDIEGSETTVLEELANADKLKLVNQVVCEYHHHVDPERESLGKLLSLLEHNGFGYQLRAGLPTRHFVRDVFQDVLIYGYQRATIGN